MAGAGGRSTNAGLTQLGRRHDDIVGLKSRMPVVWHQSWCIRRCSSLRPENKLRTVLTDFTTGSTSRHVVVSRSPSVLYTLFGRPCAYQTGRHPSGRAATTASLPERRTCVIRNDCETLWHIRCHSSGQWPPRRISLVLSATRSALNVWPTRTLHRGTTEHGKMQMRQKGNTMRPRAGRVSRLTVASPLSSAACTRGWGLAAVPDRHRLD